MPMMAQRNRPQMNITGYVINADIDPPRQQADGDGGRDVYRA